MYSIDEEVNGLMVGDRGLRLFLLLVVLLCNLVCRLLDNEVMPEDEEREMAMDCKRYGARGGQSTRSPKS